MTQSIYKMVFIALVLLTPAWSEGFQISSEFDRKTDFEQLGFVRGEVDDTFTEPITTIKIAASEMGIVKNVHVHLGDQVAPGDLLVETDMSVLEAAKRIAQSKAESKARLSAANVETQTKIKRYNKLVRLLNDGAGSPEEVERALADVDVAKQNVAAINEEIEQHRLDVIRYDAEIERRRTRSPIAGHVVDVKKRVGEFVSNTDPHLLTLVQLDTLKAVFYVPTSRAVKIRKGDDVELLLTETGQKAKGMVEFVAPITMADSGRVRIDVLIENQDRAYRSGVRCRLVHRVARQHSESSLLRR